MAIHPYAAIIPLSPANFTTCVCMYENLLARDHSKRNPWDNTVVHCILQTTVLCSTDSPLQTPLVTQREES